MPRGVAAGGIRSKQKQKVLQFSEEGMHAVVRLLQQLASCRNGHHLLCSEMFPI